MTKLLKGLNPSKALGPDELHPRVLKELAMELGPVFAHLFQQSIDTGEISKEWSLANICPLFKKGDRSPARNYRPVSLTCIPCKLLEHIVCSNIMAHLDELVFPLATFTMALCHAFFLQRRALFPSAMPFF